MNLVYDISDSLLVRFGAAEGDDSPEPRPPPPGCLGQRVGPQPHGDGGRADLEPFRAKAYGLGVEWYFAPESLLSVAVFYKDVDGFVQAHLRDPPVHRQSVGSAGQRRDRGLRHHRQVAARARSCVAGSARTSAMSER